MLADHAFLSVLGAAAFWALVSPSATASYAVGAFLGALYLFLLQRQTDSVGASSLEDVRRPPSLPTRHFFPRRSPERSALCVARG